MRKVQILTVVLLLLGTLTSSAQTLDLGIHQTNGQLERDLSGYKWNMTMMLPGEGLKEGLHKLPPQDIETVIWDPAFVPGDVYTDLWRAGGIDDPYFGRNTVKAKWVGLYEWWYSRKFRVDEAINDQVVLLCFDGVDYSCDVYLNGIHLGSHEGAFSSFSFDVTEIIRDSKKEYGGANLLMIKLDPPPKVNSSVAGLKTPWFGDYWRNLVPFGISRKVSLHTTGKVRVEDLYANTNIMDDGSADVLMEVVVENTSDVEREMTVIVSIEGKNFDADPLTVQTSKTVAPGIHKIKQNIHVKKPALWNPWDLGKPNLYTGKVSVMEGEINHDYSETSFGIREVEMAWNPGFKKGVDLSFPRTTLINGKFHFIRSACWGGPPDIFVGRTSPEEYRKIIQLARDANMNNIRIFGWHPPEIPEFYEICDELGMTVWQDMLPFGTGNFSQDRETIDRIMEEAKAVAIERRNHPSLIMMEGGEEFFVRIKDPHFGRAFLEELGDTLQSYLDLPYVPDSPLIGANPTEAGYKPKEAVHIGHGFYDMGHALMEDYFPTMDYPIIPEFMMTSVPSVESLRKFIPEDELWPPGLSWGHHWADLDRLRGMNYEVFGDEKTSSLEEFVNATQDAQGIYFQYGIEYFRRQKPRLSGISLCHLITYWPDMKWGLIDSYQQPKRSLDFVERSYQPLLVNLYYKKRRWHSNEAFKAELWVVNDLYKDFQNCQVELEIKNNSGESLHKEAFDIKKIEENSAKKFLDVSADVLESVKDQFMVYLVMKDKKGNVLSANEYMLLIGDNAEAMAEYEKYLIQRREAEQIYPYGSYYRFFPEMIRKDGKDYNSETETPRAEGFN